jgi:hypothetical protein
MAFDESLESMGTLKAHYLWGDKHSDGKELGERNSRD